MSTMMSWAKGIDVSHHNGTVDFAKVKESGHSFVGVKATEGNRHVDRMLNRNQQAVRLTNFDLVIYYHFARSGKAEDQANHLMRAVGSLQENERLCLDLEAALPTPPEKMIEWVDTFYEVMEKQYPAMKQFIYTSARIWRMFGNPDWPRAERGDVALWAPRYNGQGVQPNLPAPWAKTSWQIWQWSDGEFPPAPVPGVPGHVDNNRWHGEIADLRAWMRSPSSGASAEVVAEMFVRSLDPGQRNALLRLLGDSPEDERLRGYLHDFLS